MISGTASWGRRADVPKEKRKGKKKKEREETKGKRVERVNDVKNLGGIHSQSG